MEGHVFTQLDLQLASVVCEFIGIRQFRLGLIVIIHLKQAFINQIQHADHIALVQLQRAQLKGRPWRRWRRSATRETLEPPRNKTNITLSRQAVRRVKREMRMVDLLMIRFRSAEYREAQSGNNTCGRYRVRAGRPGVGRRILRGDDVESYAVGAIHGFFLSQLSTLP